MIKKISLPVRLFLAFALSLALSAFIIADDDLISYAPTDYIKQSGDWLYYDNGDYASVCGYTGFEEHITVPSEIDGLEVREVSGKGNFYYGTDGIAGGSYYDDLLSDDMNDYNNFFPSQDIDYLTSTSKGTITKRVTLPDTVKIIGDHTFYYCTHLEQVDMPEGLTRIGNRAFYCCTELIKADIPEGVETIGFEAFGGSYIYDSTLSGGLTLPSTLKKIGARAFAETAIKELDIPDSVTEIGEQAFSLCSLERVKLSGSLTTISPQLFLGCNYLQSVEIPEGVTSIGRYAFGDCAELKEIKLPQSLTEISTAAFSGCYSLESAQIPDSVRIIGMDAFNGCLELKSVTLPQGLTELPSDLFTDCQSLRSVTVPEGVTEIGSGAFKRCSALEEIYLPQSVRSIGNIFVGCGKLEDIYFGVSKETAEALWGTEIMELMWQGEYFGEIMKENVNIHYAQASAAAVEEEPQRDILKDILRAAALFFALTFLAVLILKLIQTAKTAPKKEERQEGNVLSANSAFSFADMRECRHCGAKSGGEAAYCYNCGKKLPKSAK